MLRKIGIREAKAQLSKLVRDVQQGGECIITDRGRPVARITAIQKEQMPAEVHAVIARIHREWVLVDVL